MIEYPSINPCSKIKNKPCIAFYKYDGSNLRWEYQKGKGFINQGTRTQLFDKSHDVFGCSVEIFHSKLADDLIKVFENHKKLRNAKIITVFTEFFGPNSFAGLHKPEDQKELVLFDVHIKGSGILGPTDFINSFGHLNSAKVIYTGCLDETLINNVKEGKYSVNEGIICKSQTAYVLWMVKIKTNSWIEKLKNTYQDKWQELV